MDYFKEKKVVLVGVGKWGRNHLKTLAELLPAESLGFYEPDRKARREASKIAPPAIVYNTFDTILNDDRVSAVVIAAPANLHFPLALEAVRAGKHVFVEKPLAMNVAEGATLVETAEMKGITFAVGHILLFDPAYIKLKQLVNRGNLGDVFYTYAERAKLGTVRTAEDVLFSLASHDVAMVLDVFGKEPITVSCTGTHALRETIIDSATLDLEFNDGVKAHIFASWLHPTTARRMTVVGSNASAVWDESAGPRLVLLKRGAKITRDVPEIFNKGSRVIAVHEVDKLRAEISDFLECVKSGEDPKCNGRAGLGVLKVLSAARKSAAASGAPVFVEAEPERNNDIPPDEGQNDG